MKKIASFWAISILLALGVFGCASIRQQSADAIAVLSPTQGNDARGTVYFTRLKDGVRVDGEISGLKPGSHGFHIHDKGDCSSPDANSAGGHYNPTGMPHGSPNA